MATPTFDPNAPFEEINAPAAAPAATPVFDPNAKFEEVEVASAPAAKTPQANVTIEEQATPKFQGSETTTAPVFWDDATPLKPLAQADEQEYLRMLNDRSVTPEAVSQFVASKGYSVNPTDIAKSRAAFDEYDKKTGAAHQIGAAYQDAPVMVETPQDGAVGAGARGFGSGALAGGLDELGAFADMLGATDGRENIFNSDRRWADIWHDNQRKNSAILHSDEENHYGAQLTGEIAGGLVLPFGARAKTAAELMKVGAAYGGASGFLGTDGSFTDRAAGAALGIPTGALVGLVGGKALEGAGKLYKKVRGNRSVEAMVEGAAPAEWVKQPDGSYTMDSGGGRVRVSPENARVHEVVQEVNRLAKDWKNVPDIEVLRTLDDIADEGFRARVKAEAPDAIGFLGQDGKVRIVSANVKNDADVKSVLYHETLGHYGLAQKFGEDLSTLLDDLYERGNTGFKEKVDQWLLDNPDAYANNPNRVQVATEEVLAEMAQEGDAAFKHTVFDRFANLVKNYGRQMGMDLKFSDREINSIMGMAQNAVINGKTTAAENGFRLMRSFGEMFTEDNPVVVDTARMYDIPEDRIAKALTEPDFQAEVKMNQRMLANGEDPMGARRFQPLSSEDAKRMSMGEDVERFMRSSQRRAEDGESELYLPKAPREAVKVLEDGYVPTTRTWEEAKAMAEQRGIRPSEIRKMGDAQAIDKKLFQMEALAQRLDTKLSSFNEKFDNGTWTPADKANYMKTVFEQNMLMGHIMDNQAEVGRALQAIKALSFTKKKLGSINEALREAGGPQAMLADDEVFERFVRAMQAQQGNPAGQQALARNIIKPYWWQYALTFRHSAMLSGLGTHAKNAADNAMMIARELEETAMALPGGVIRKGLRKAGMNVEEGVTPAEVAGRAYGLMRAAGDLNRILGETKTAFMQGHGNQQLSKTTEMAEARIPIVSKVGDALHAADTFFRAFHDSANAYAIGVREAQDAGLKGMAAFQDGANRAVNRSGWSERMASEVARNTNVSLLVDTPFFGRVEAWKQIRPNMTGEEQAKAFAANIALPFFRVTDRLLFQKLRRSPLSILDRVTREDLRAGGPRRDIAIARTLFGSALIYNYWNAAGNGEVVGEGPEFQKKAALEAGGYQSNSAVKDGKYVDASGLNLSFNWADVQNAVAANVATIRAEYDKSGPTDSVATKLGMVTSGLLATLASNSFAENITQYTEPFTGGQSDGETTAEKANLVASLASQFIPAIVRQANAMYIDPSKRDTTGDKSFSDRVWGRLKNDIPGLSKTLPLKFSVYGNEMERGKTLFGMYNYQTVKDEPEIQELQRLERTQKEPLVTRAPNRFNRNGQEVKLTGPEYAEFQRVSGEYFMLGMKAVNNLPQWKDVGDDVKKAAIKELLKEARDAAKDQLYPEKGEPDIVIEDGEDDAN